MANASTPFRGMRVKQFKDRGLGSPATIWRLAKTDPSFPKPIKVSPGITIWDEAEVDSYYKAKKALRGAA